MRVLFVSPEVFPLVKTGGLGDVAGALPAALQAAGADLRLLMPAYAGTRTATKAKPACSLGDPFGLGETVILQGRLPGNGIRVWLVDNPALFDRPGGPYQDGAGLDWPDNDLRFALLAWAAARLSQPSSPLAWKPDILHGHDWQCGLAGAYLQAWGGPRPGIVFTIHNMAFQGLFPPSLMPRIGLPWSLYTMAGCEFWGQLSYLKAGLVYADRLTTVSPSYAGEIQLPAAGFGLEGVLAERATILSGILNGADYRIWDPAKDGALSRRYDDQDLVAGKAANKAAIQAELGLSPDPKATLLVVISRLSDQKGMDLLLAALPAALAQGAQLALLGSGERPFEQALLALAEARPTQVAVRIGYSEPLAHRLQAAGDVLVMPLRFEPCGLTQIYALRYGTVPVVRRTGGLADTVVDATYDSMLQGTATGLLFDQATASALQGSLERAIGMHRHAPQWLRLQRQGMRQSFTWDRAAAAYLDLYRQIRPVGISVKPPRRAQL